MSVGGDSLARVAAAAVGVVVPLRARFFGETRTGAVEGVAGVGGIASSSSASAPRLEWWARIVKVSSVVTLSTCTNVARPSLPVADSNQTMRSR